MNLVIWLAVGGLIGWLASLFMKSEFQQGPFLNIVFGIVGAMLGGWFISPLIGVDTLNQDTFSFGALLVSFCGATLLLALVNMLRRGSVR